MNPWRTRGQQKQTERWLRQCAQVGDDAWLDGEPTIIAAQGGRIVLGKRFTLSSRPMQSHMVSLGSLVIDDDVSIGHGAAIAATVGVTIGPRVRIGPFFVLMDTDFHGERAKAGARPSTDTALGPESGYAPIAIGADVTIGAHVTILRGTTIGDGATIASGSVVNGEIPAGAMARGVPALVVGDHDGRGGLGADVADIVSRVFGLSAAPDPTSGPDDIPQWDSLGSLKLLLSLEEAFGVSLDENLVSKVRSVGDLQAAVERSRQGVDGR